MHQPILADYKTKTIMEIIGKIIRVLPVVEGTSLRGNQWRKQGYVIETPDRYPRQIYFELWNDNIEQYNLQVGHIIQADVDVESREYNSKYYTTLTAYKVEVQNAQNAPEEQPAQPTAQQVENAQTGMPF